MMPLGPSGSQTEDGFTDNNDVITIPTTSNSSQLTGLLNIGLGQCQTAGDSVVTMLPASRQTTTPAISEEDAHQMWLFRWGIVSNEFRNNVKRVRQQRFLIRRQLQRSATVDVVASENVVIDDEANFEDDNDCLLLPSEIRAAALTETSSIAAGRSRMLTDNYHYTLQSNNHTATTTTRHTLGRTDRDREPSSSLSFLSGKASIEAKRRRIESSNEIPMPSLFRLSLLHRLVGGTSRNNSDAAIVVGSGDDGSGKSIFQARSFVDTAARLVHESSERFVNQLSNEMRGFQQSFTTTTTAKTNDIATPNINVVSLIGGNRSANVNAMGNAVCSLVAKAPVVQQLVGHFQQLRDSASAKWHQVASALLLRNYPRVGMITRQ